MVTGNSHRNCDLLYISQKQEGLQDDHDNVNYYYRFLVYALS